MGETPRQFEFAILINHDLIEVAPPANLAPLAAYVLAGANAPGAWAITLLLTTDAHLRGLHRDFMGIDEETDVMTFPLDDPVSGVSGGEIAVSVDTARDNAADVGHSLESEIRFLLVHGLLHLLGWDDTDADRRERMLTEQARLIAEFDRLAAAGR